MVAALGQKIKGRVVSFMAGRMRQANVEGGRKIPRQVKLTEFEDNALYFAAQRAGMTPARFLKESALSHERGMSVTERHTVVKELFRLKRSLAAIGTNINQLAKWANAEESLNAEISKELHSSLAHLNRLMVEITETTPKLAVSPEEADAS